MSFKYPINDTLGNIFKIIQGHQITDEEIYKSYGGFPVYTGSGDIKGYWDKSLVKKEDLPCLTYATKAFDGTITLRNEVFDANNTAVLILKEKYKGIILLEYLVLILPQIFLNLMTSKEGVSYLNKEIVENINITIPEKQIQKKFITKHNTLNMRCEKAEQILSKCEKLLNKVVDFKYNNYQVKNFPIFKCLDYISGSSNLTEEKNYQRLKMHGIKYQLLTGATIKENAFVMLDETSDVPKFDHKEGLLVTRKGKAGNVRYLPKGRYTLNDDAYILYVKKEFSYNINLKWLAIQYKTEFLSYTSNSDNGTWNMTAFFTYTKINIPSYEEQLMVVKKYEMLEKRIKMLEKIKDKYCELIIREIV